MSQIVIEVTEQRKRVFDALCLKNDITIEQMFENHLACVENREGGLDPTDLPEDQEAAVKRIEAKALKAKAERAVLAAEVVTLNTLQP